MSLVSKQWQVCDQCGGAIPPAADRVTVISSSITIGGQVTTYASLDFCCAAHLGAWMVTQPQIPAPDPPYPPPG